MPSEVKLEQVNFPLGTIKLDEKFLEVQIADTEPRKVRGLMFQDTLPYDQGMLFVFDEPGEYMLRVVASDGSMFSYENLPITVTQ